MGRKRLLFVFGILVLLVAACAREVPTAPAASTPPATTSAKPRTLRMMMSGEPGGPPPFYAMHGQSIVAQPIVYNVMEPLVDVGKKGEPVPKLATRWEQPDSVTWRFYLRRGVKFHNGDDFTAQDVVEWLKWNIELKEASMIYKNVPIEEVVAIDDYTVDLIFATPQPLLLISGRVNLIPPRTISRDNRPMFGTHPIGTGPYRFVEWNKGQYIKLARFEGYWGPRPEIDDVKIIFRQEEGVRLAALQAGEVDWVNALSPESASRAPKVVRMPSPDTVWLRFDEVLQKDPIFADQRLRLAVEYAIDRQALVALYAGFATPSLGQFASPGEFGFNPGLKSRPYELEKAKALVREAGAVGKTVSFVGYSDRWTKGREVGEAIAHMIEQTGIKVKLMILPSQEAIKYNIITAPNRLLTDIFMSATDASLEVESRYRQGFVEGGVNFSLDDLEPTKLFKEALAETDHTKRGEKVGKAWAYVYEQAHYVPVFKLEFIWGLVKNLEWNVDIAGRPFFADMRFTD